MINYEEKEKKLDNVLNELNSMTNKGPKDEQDISSLNLEKNQLLGEKKNQIEIFSYFQNSIKN
jgi:hypothetical protein